MAIDIIWNILEKVNSVNDISKIINSLVKYKVVNDTLKSEAQIVKSVVCLFIKDLKLNQLK